MQIVATLSSLPGGTTVGSPGDTFPNVTLGNTYTIYELNGVLNLVDDNGHIDNTVASSGIPITIGGTNSHWTVVSITTIGIVPLTNP